MSNKLKPFRKHSHNNDLPDVPMETGIFNNNDELNQEEIQNLSNQYILQTYNRYPVTFKFGTGELLYDTNNKEYIDFQSGIAVTNLGHCEPDLIEVIRDQADRLFHASNLYYSDLQAKLAQALIVNSFPGKVFFCNSGTEANEAAFKLMRRWGITRNIDKPVVLALKGSFHGRTLASMSMTGQSSIRDGFGELVPYVDFVEPNDEDSLMILFEKYEGRVAGLIMELIQGEGGVKPLHSSFVQLARKLTEETNSLLVIDEIQTGMGRTGKLFCFEHFGFYPDAFTLAKALGNGVPIGALIVAEPFVEVLGKGFHGSTFGGNPIACAVGLETIKIILSRELLESSEEVSNYIFRRLESMKSKYSFITDVRGRGFHIGLELKEASRPVVELALKKGLVVNSTANTVIRIMPPINLRMEYAEKGLNLLEESLKEIYA
jgi:acetylornithine/N-succinyldiaminopimelate aminotransferase